MPKLLQFGLFGFMLQMGMGVGFSAGDAAFLSNVGADKLPVIFLLIPPVMLLYTGVFSYLLVRHSIGHMVDVTLALLIAGGAALWALLNGEIAPEWHAAVYYGLKLYLAVWYIALYTLFWNFTDSYFDIQDAKRLFPLFAAFCSLGTAAGAMIVSLGAGVIPMPYFMLIWAGIAIATVPVSRMLQARWPQIAESEVDAVDDAGAGKGAFGQLAAVARALRFSPYTLVLAATLFVTLLLTNLAEFQYSTVLEQGRSEAELAALFGQLYAASNIFNLIVCLFVFNRLVTRFGVRNVAFILPLSYFAAFGYFFLHGGTGAALAAFFAYHGVLTSIEYNNQNLLFNAVPSDVKRPLRTVVEGMCEPLASLLAGGFLLLFASRMDMRELSGIGLIVGAALIAIVVFLRQLYPTAMARNMRRGWMNFADRHRAARADAPAAGPGPDDLHLVPGLIAGLGGLPQAGRLDAVAMLGRIGDTETIPQLLAAADTLAPRDRRAIAASLVETGETAIPRLVSALQDRRMPFRARAVAARALAELSYGQLLSQIEGLVHLELREARALLAGAAALEHGGKDACVNDRAVALLARASRERVGAAIDFALEMLALAGLLPTFDLLVVSLHSANPKVRGNAIEAIETGVDYATFQLLRPLLHAQAAPAGDGSGAAAPDLAPLLEDALRSGRPVEALAAAHALHARLAAPAFARIARQALRPGIAPMLRADLRRLLGIAPGHGPALLAVIDALARSRELGGASLDALAALAVRAMAQAGDEPALRLDTAEGPAWVCYRDVDEIAARHADLALVMLKSQDERPYAA